MAVSEDFKNYVIDQLSGIENVEVKKLFGGIGFFKEGLMFGMIGGDKFRLKVDEHNQADYEDKGMQPLFSKGKKKGMPYWEVPAEVLENQDLLMEWGMEAYAAAVRSKKE